MLMLLFARILDNPTHNFLSPIFKKVPNQNMFKFFQIMNKKILVLYLG